MEQADFTEFANSLGTLAEIMNKELSPLAITAYFTSLKQYSAKHIEQAISQAMVECKFFPKPVELIDMLSGGSHRIEDRALQQAIVVTSAVRRVGRYQSVKFSDPVTTAVIESGFGGWVKLCADMTEENEKWVKKDFEKIYLSYSRGNITSQNILPGIAEIENQYKGRLEYIPEPILIDDDSKKLIEGIG